MTTDLVERPDVMPGIRIDQIVIGERARKDYGDLTDLMDSIRQVGLLQPVGLAPGNRLLFGGRRLEACRRLGWESIPFVRPETREDALSLLKAERDENTCRKDMTLSELVKIGRRIEELERPRADARKAEGQRLGAEVRWGLDAFRAADRQASDRSANETRRKVGDALGISGATYERAKKVIDLAEDESAPEEIRAVAQEAVKEMDATGKAWRPYKRVQEVLAPSPPSPLAIPQPARMGGNRRKHAQVLQAMTTNLAGLTAATDEITELDNSVTKEEAAQLVRDLSRSIRSLNQIKSLLKERSR